LLSRGRDREPGGFADAFEPLIARRAAREPVAQITGVREFWGLAFEVTPDVLIPRPETELIVEAALAFAGEHPCRHVIDVGTGSGCLAVAIARELPDVQVTAVDRSEAALVVARRNAARYGVADRVDVRQGDLLEGMTAHADLIVSNPPYVPDGDAIALAPEVVEHEPSIALFGGPSGTEVIHRLLQQAGSHLAPHGRLVVEFGFGQESTVAALAEATGWRVIRVYEDLQGIARTIVLARGSL
jgi:release factor glutamine methyltransferase